MMELEGRGTATNSSRVMPGLDVTAIHSKLKVGQPVFCHGCLSDGDATTPLTTRISSDINAIIIPAIVETIGNRHGRTALNQNPVGGLRGSARNAIQKREKTKKKMFSIALSLVR